MNKKLETLETVTHTHTQDLLQYLNKITLGDSYKLIKNIPDKSIDLIYTDIPYLYGSGGISKGSALSQRIQKIRTQDLANISDGIDYSILDDFVRIMKKINIFIWCSKMQILDIMNYFANLGNNYEILVWCKTNPTPATSNTWLPDIEYCLYFREKGVKLNDGYELKSKYFIKKINKTDKDIFNHPTIKPLELVKRHIEHTTQLNDIVLDCFSGSGTTCVAAKETKRQFIGFEINKEYWKISNDRLKGITANGQISFDTLKENI